MKKLLIRLVLLAAVVGAAWGGYALFQKMPQRQAQVATTKVRRSDVVVRSFARGELRAVRSVTLIAPNLFGTVQVTRLAPLGSLAREKDLIVEFDDAELLSRLEEKQLELDQIDEQIKKAEADLAIRNNQDQVELLRARYAVRRSELEVKRNELLPLIDQRKNELNLEESRRRLKQLESDIKSRVEQAQAEMAVLRERKNKGLREMSREKMRLSQVKLLAPMTGLVAVRQNRTGMFFPGMTIPDIREGDQIQPGIPVADVLDLSELEVVAKIGELDRANLRDGQDVLMRLDAVGGKVFHGKIKSMSGTATANIFSGDPAKKFDVVFSVDMKELLEGLGAKPEQIRKVVQTAEANRKKPPVPAFAGAMGGGGMMMARSTSSAGAGGSPAMGGAPQGGGMGGNAMAGGGPPQGGPGVGADAAGGERRAGGPGGRGGGPGASLSDEDRKKVQSAMQKALNGRTMQDLSQEERQKVMAEVRKAVPAMAAAGGGGGFREGGARTAAGAGPPGAMPGGGGGMPGMMGGRPGQFSAKEMENAKLPATVGADSQLEVLLRPGLLADVEIILEKLPNAINIPNTAVFEKDNKPIVYVRNGSKWDEREIKIAKRSESVTVIASGLKAGETVAIADPMAKPGDNKKKDKGGGAVGSMPGGKS